MLTGATAERVDATDAALRNGLRAVDATTLPAFDPSHTARGRVWLLTYRALSVGGRTFAVVVIAPALVDRVAAILARPDGDVTLERLARWAARGGLDA